MTTEWMTLWQEPRGTTVHLGKQHRYKDLSKLVWVAARRYPVGSTTSWSWSSGYIEGNAARLKNSQQMLDGTSEH